MAQWVRVASLAQLAEGRPLLVTLDEVDLAVYRVGEQVFATDDLCSHAHASLSEGEQAGFIITCPRHGGQFDIRTGQAVHMPAFAPIRTYPVKVEDGSVWVEVDG